MEERTGYIWDGLGYFWVISNKRLAQAGYGSILDRYESLYLCNRIAVYRTVCTVVRGLAVQPMGSLPLLQKRPLG